MCRGLLRGRGVARPARSLPTVTMTADVQGPLAGGHAICCVVVSIGWTDVGRSFSAAATAAASRLSPRMYSTMLAVFV